MAAGWVLVLLILMICGNTLIAAWYRNATAHFVLDQVTSQSISQAGVYFNDCQSVTIVECIPDLSKSPRLGGYYYLTQGRLAEAVELLKPAASTDRIAAFWLGEAYYRQGLNDEAIAAWRMADASAYFLNRGHQPYAEGDFLTACKYYLLAVAIGPEVALNHMYAGHCYWRLRDYVHAEQEYNRAIELDPAYGYPYLHWALMLSGDLKQPEQARRILQRCVNEVQSDYWRAECATALTALR